MKTGQIETEREYDDRAIECGLIRCMSDLKKRELKNIKLSEDFQHRLLLALEKTEQEQVTEETFAERFSQLMHSRVFRYSMAFASVALASTFLLMNLLESTGQFQSESISSHVKSITPADYRELDEEFRLINEIRQSPDDIHCLKRLEEYYIHNGNLEKASKIHYTLENISQ
jgi:hypothetical protein